MSKKILVAPSVLSADFGNLREEVIAIDVIGRFLREDVNTYIDGHNKPYSARQMKMLVRWQLMQDELKKKV